MPERPLRILELRSVAGTGGGPEKTILLGTARTDPRRYRITVCYLRGERDPLFTVDQRANELSIDYVDVREPHSFAPAIWSRLRGIVRSRAIDLVHAHDYKTDLLGLLLARREGLISLATAHGWAGDSIRERLLYYPADRWLLARYPRVIAVSTPVRKLLIGSGCRPENITVVWNAIDPAVFRRDRSRDAIARSTFGFGGDDVAIGSVGRLEPLKHFGLLIDAFARVVRRLPRARLVIAGDGSLREALSLQIETLGLSGVCRLLGHVPDVKLLHHALDLFVQSSATEGAPNVVLEAMALETPIVATDAGGTAELARHDREALIVPTRDVAALAAAMLASIENPEATRTRVAAARRRVETDLSFDTRVRTVEAIYDELAAARTGRRLTEYCERFVDR